MISGLVSQCYHTVNRLLWFQCVVFLCVSLSLSSSCLMCFVVVIKYIQKQVLLIIRSSELLHDMQRPSTLHRNTPYQRLSQTSQRWSHNYTHLHKYCTASPISTHRNTQHMLLQDLLSFILSWLVETVWWWRTMCVVLNQTIAILCVVFNIYWKWRNRIIKDHLYSEENSEYVL